MSAQKDWTGAELSLLRRLREQGLSARQMMPFIPHRTFKAIDNQLGRHAWGRKPLKPKIATPAPNASERLRQAILRAIWRHANDNGIDIDTAASQLLSLPTVEKQSQSHLSAFRLSEARA